MSSNVELFSIGGAVALLLLVVELLRRRLLKEEYAIGWLIAGGGLLWVALKRELLTAAAQWMGIFYPPALLLLWVVFVGYAGSLWMFVVLTRQRAQIERLAEEVALLDARHRELEARLPKPTDPAEDR